MFKKIKRAIRKKKRLKSDALAFEGSSAKKKENRIVRSHRRRNLQLIAVGLCLVGLIAGFVFLQYAMNEERPTETSNGIVYTSFKAQVENGTPQQLADMYLDEKENPLASLPERIDHFSKKEKIAKRLVETGEGDLKNFGSAACFELLARRDSLLLMHDLVDLDSNGEQVCESYLDKLSNLDGMIRSNSESDESILMSRQLAVLLGEYFVVRSKSEDLGDSFVALYAETAKQCSKNRRLIMILFDIAMHSFRDNASDDPLKAFIKQFDSKPLGNEMAVFGAEKLSQKDIAAANKSLYEAKTPAAVDQAFQAIKTGIESTDNATELSAQLDRISDFSKLGEHKRGQELLDLVIPKITDSNFEWLKRRLQFLEARFSNFGKEFSLSGIRTLDGEDATFRTPNSTLKIVLVGNTKTRNESQEMLKDAIRLNRSVGENSAVSLCVSFLVHDIGGQVNGLQQLKTASLRITEIDFWVVSDKTEGGKTFLEKLPLNDAPFFIVLDKNNHPVSIGSSPEMVEEIVSQAR